MTECFRTYQKPPSLITTKDIAMDQFSKVTWRQLSFIPSFTSLRQIRMPISFNMLNLRSFVAVLLLALFCGVCAEAGPASGVFGSAASLVHPKLIRLFSGTMADVGPSAVQTVNVSASAKLGNEYHVADVQRHNSLVYVDDDQSGRAWFGYKYLGAMTGQIHVLRTLDCGGGSGVFHDLLLVQEEAAPNGDRLLTFVAQRSLGDRTDASVTVEAERVMVGPGRNRGSGRWDGFVLTLAELNSPSSNEDEK